MRPLPQKAEHDWWHATSGTKLPGECLHKTQSCQLLIFFYWHETINKYSYLDMPSCSALMKKTWNWLWQTCLYATLSLFCVCTDLQSSHSLLITDMTAWSGSPKGRESGLCSSISSHMWFFLWDYLTYPHSQGFPTHFQTSHLCYCLKIINSGKNKRVPDITWYSIN